MYPNILGSHTNLVNMINNPTINKNYDLYIADTINNPEMFNKDGNNYECTLQPKLCKLKNILTLNVKITESIIEKKTGQIFFVNQAKNIIVLNTSILTW